MKGSYLIVVIALAIAICTTGHRAVGAGPSSADTATVKGTVKFEGAPPTPTRINQKNID
jgi:hypothetical protein